MAIFRLSSLLTISICTTLSFLLLLSSSSSSVSSSSLSSSFSTSTVPSFSSLPEPRLEDYAPFSIDAFGAVAGIDTHDQALQNGKAFSLALAAALNTTNSSTRAILVPAGKVYSYLPSVASFPLVENVTIFIEGTLNVSTANFSSSFPGWPNPYPVLSFSACANVNMVSSTRQGLVNGRGNLWWWYTIFIADHRNNLLYVDSCTNFLLAGIKFLNAPQYHVNLRDMVGVNVQNVTVLVDIEDQLNIFRYLAGEENIAEKSSTKIIPSEVTATLWRMGHAYELEKITSSVSSSPSSSSFQWTMESSSSVRPPFDIELPSAETIQRNRATFLARSNHPTIQALRTEEWYQTLQQSLRSTLSTSSLSFPSVSSTAIGVVPPVPMIWALNTDGIDISGINIVVSNCSVTNFDDSVCTKPISNGDSLYGSNCTSNFTITDVEITWGVGVSMGSVPPDVGGNCISNVYSSNVVFNNPLKAIYIKPNPMKVGQPATGIISNILYENVTINSPVWWTIWVGTQQQQQPGSSGTGCSFLYPLFNSSCPTDPQVTVENITLRNIQVYNPVLSSGVLLMNSSNPGTQFTWDNVYFHNISSFPEANGSYLCESVQGIATGNTYPVPPCFQNNSTA